jgi:hypothetical protein
MNNNSVLFSVSYDGEALANHEMNVKDIAPALLALGELIEEANRMLNGDKTKVAVNIKATEPGSIIVALTAHQDLLSQAISLFDSEGVNAFLNLKEILKILGIGGGGVLGLIKWIKGREIKNVTRVDTGDFKIELEDGEVTVTKKVEIELFQAIKIRKNIETIVNRPLKKDGVEAVSFKVDNNEGVIVKDEADYFVAPIVEQEILGETEIEQSLQIVNISFQEGGKWRFSDGNATFYADILDIAFLETVQKNEVAFAKDDVLQVKMHRKQYMTDAGIRADYTVLKVLGHRSAAVQIKLPFNI